MTLYYIMASQKMVDVDNLLIPNDGYVFINNINNGEGSESKQQYRCKNNMIDIKFLKDKCEIYHQLKDKCEIYDQLKDKSYKLFNIHFQGTAKRLVTNKLKDILVFKNDM